MVDPMGEAPAGGIRHLPGAAPAGGAGWTGAGRGLYRGGTAMPTPLRKVAISYLRNGTANLVASIFLTGVIIVISIDEERVTPLGFIGLIFGFSIFLIALWQRWSAKNIDEADTVIGEIFRLCPLCFGSKTLIEFDESKFKGKFLCYDCDSK
jgi:hypothetical protein